LAGLAYVKKDGKYMAINRLGKQIPMIDVNLHKLNAGR
jgi:hypothetical protein